MQYKYTFTKDLLQVLELHAAYSLGDNDPWYTLVDSKKQLQEFQAEVEEMIAEIQNIDSDESLEDEIGDAFWDFLGVIRKLEDDKRIDPEKVFQKVHAKFARRKPYLLTGEEVTKQEAMKMWNEAKRKEGYPEDRLWHEDREKHGNT